MREKPPFLFHSSCSAIIGDVLLPKPNKTVTGISGKFIFAGSDETLAYAYSMKGQGERGRPVMRACFPVNGAICSFMEGYHLLPHLPKGCIYKVPSAGFEEILFPDGQSTGEFIATEPIPLAGVQVICDITPEHVMARNVQIFFLNDPEIVGEGFLKAIDSCRARAQDKREADDEIGRFINAHLSSGNILHFNAICGINPYSKLSVLVE